MKETKVLQRFLALFIAFSMIFSISFSVLAADKSDLTYEGYATEESESGEESGDESGDEPAVEPSGDESGEEPSGDEPVDEPSGEEPGDEPSGEEPGDEPSGEEPGDEPSGEEPGDEPSGEEPGDEPSGEEPGDEPSGEEPGDEPSGEEPGDEPSGDEPSGEEPGDEPSGEEPGDEPSGEEPGDEPSGEEPSGEEPSGEEPSGEEPSGEEPSGDEPSGEEPSGEEPSGEEPSGEEPSGETSGETSGDTSGETEPTQPSTSGGSSGSSGLKITVKSAKNGKITPDGKVSVKRKTSKEFTFKADDGYVVDKVLVDGKEVKVSGNKYVFEDITKSHTLEVTFKAENESSDWATDELKAAKKDGLVPECLKDKNLSREVSRLEFASICVTLFQKITDKLIKPVEDNPFIDCSDEEVLKAYNVGITIGVSDIKFDPNSDITREQMATMLYRTINKAGKKADAKEKVSFTDESEISEYAVSSVESMTSAGVIKGVGDGKFNPKGTASREQALVLAERVLKTFIK